jgi:hypothetical protein
MSPLDRSLNATRVIGRLLPAPALMAVTGPAPSLGVPDPVDQESSSAAVAGDCLPISVRAVLGRWIAVISAISAGDIRASPSP